MKKSILFLGNMIGLFMISFSSFAQLELHADIQEVRCHAEQNGSISLSATGGTSPYTYTIGTMNDSVRGGLPPGNYFCSVQDALGEIDSMIVTVTEPNPLTIGTEFIVPGMYPHCLYDTTGTGYIHAHGGTPPYSYIENFGNGTVSYDSAFVLFFDVWMPGYAIRDARGCTTSMDQGIMYYGQDPYTLPAEGHASCASDSTGWMFVGIFSGMEITWSDGGTTGSRIEIPTGTYGYTVTEWHCVYTGSVTVPELPKLEASIETIGDSVWQVHLSGDTLPTAYNRIEYMWFWEDYWNPLQSSSSPIQDTLRIPKTPGRYFVDVLYAYNCETTAWIEKQSATNIQIVSEKSIRAYPNPTTSSITITFPKKGTWYGEVVNAIGETSDTFSFNGSEGVIDTDKLPVGIYFIHVRNILGAHNTLRIVKSD